MAANGIMCSDLPAPVPEHRSADSDFGNFIDEDRIDELEFIAEPWHQYGEGDNSDDSRVFYPICLGEVLNERYLVEHKIAYGGFSTVWMAHDLQEKRDVALKIMCLGDWAETEACLQEKIIQDVQDTSHLVTLLDTFLLPRSAGDDRQHRGSCVSFHGPMSLLPSAEKDVHPNGHSHVCCSTVARGLGEFTQSWSCTPR